MTRPILFDFNGTLIFDTSLVDMAWIRLIKEIIDVVPTQEELSKIAHGTPAINALTYFLGNDVEKEKMDKYVFLMDVYYRDFARQYPEIFKLAPGAYEFLDYLKENNFPMTIATSAPKLNVDLFYDELKIDRWFDRDLLMYNDGSFPGKPAPDIYIKAAKKIGYDISECVVFEDAISGIQSAKRANAKKIIAITDLNDDEELIEAGADIVFHDFLNLDKILKEIQE